jgi:hypothetical protein
MGMTGHHDVYTARDRIELQGLQIMQNVDRPFRQSNEIGFGICDSPVAVIHVSSDRGNRGDAAQRVYNFWTPDIAALNDVIHAARRRSASGLSSPCVSEIIPILKVIGCNGRWYASVKTSR